MSCSLFTLRGNGTRTGTGNWTSTTGNNGSWFLCLSQASVNIPVQHISTHWFRFQFLYLSQSSSHAVWISHNRMFIVTEFFVSSCILSDLWNLCRDFKCYWVTSWRRSRTFGETFCVWRAAVTLRQRPHTKLPPPSQCSANTSENCTPHSRNLQPVKPPKSTTCKTTEIYNL